MEATLRVNPTFKHWSDEEDPERRLKKISSEMMQNKRRSCLKKIFQVWKIEIKIFLSH